MRNRLSTCVALSVLALALAATKRTGQERTNSPLRSQLRERSRVNDRALLPAPQVQSSSYLASGVALSDECNADAGLALSDGTAVTITRSSTATCSSSDGGVTTMATNTPRLQRDPLGGGAHGLLKEGSVKNYIIWSEDITQSGAGKWNNQNGAAQITSNNTTAPDGTLTADEYKWPTSVSVGPMYQNPSIASPLTNNITVSAYVKAKGTGNRASVGMDCSAGGVTSCTCATSDGRACTMVVGGVIGAGACAGWIDTTTPTSNWVRLSVNGHCTSEKGSVFMLLYPVVVAGGAQTGDVAFWGMQLERGNAIGGATAYPSSYAGTSAATPITKSADVVSFAHPSVIGDNEGCVYATVWTRNTNTSRGSGESAPAPRWFSTSGGSAYLDTSTTVGKFVDGTNSLSATAGSSVDGRSVVASMAWRGSMFRGSLDGVSTIGTFDRSIIGTGTFYLGDNAGSGNDLNGFIEQVYLKNKYTSCP